MAENDKIKKKRKKSKEYGKINISCRKKRRLNEKMQKEKRSLREEEFKLTEEKKLDVKAASDN